MRISRALLATAIVVAGCQSQGSVDARGPSKLMRHSSAIVSVPATFGYVVGSIVGAPVLMVALPVTAVVRFAIWTRDGDDDANVTDVIGWPQLACATGMSYAFGGLPYLILGDDRRARHELVPTTADVAADDPAPAPKEPLPPPPSFSRDELPEE